jgi:hypothetical protein
MGEYIVQSFLLLCMLLWLAGRMIRTVDDDGEVKKAATEGFASWLKNLFKK